MWLIGEENMTFCQNYNDYNIVGDQNVDTAFKYSISVIMVTKTTQQSNVLW